MTSILGLDISLSCGYSVLSSTGKLVVSGCIKVKPKDLKARLSFLTSEVLKIVEEFKPSLIIIEQVYHGPSASTTALLNKMQGAVLVSIPSNIEVVFIEVLKARAEVLGRGKRHSKLDVFEYIKKLFRLKAFKFSKDNDQTDAILLSLYGITRYKTI